MTVLGGLLFAKHCCPNSVSKAVERSTPQHSGAARKTQFR